MTNKIIRICKHHGETEFYQWKYKNKNYKRCKICIDIKNKKYRLENKENKKEYNKKYWIKNKEKISTIRKNDKHLKYRRDHYQSNISHFREYYSKKQNDYRELLHDDYIKRILCENSNLNFKDIPKELIEVKRIQINLNRYLKEKKMAIRNMDNLRDFLSDNMEKCMNGLITPSTAQANSNSAGKFIQTIKLDIDAVKVFGEPLSKLLENNRRRNGV